MSEQAAAEASVMHHDDLALLHRAAGARGRTFVVMFASAQIVDRPTQRVKRRARR
jgi:hypothetical protein